MNKKFVKVYRKEARAILKSEHSAALTALELFRWMPFKERVKIAWKILRGNTQHQKETP